jgi:F0F1-type ATP synthase membrane subunit c/vacuolar-type H+-ATPase subunit K
MRGILPKSIIILTSTIFLFAITTYTTEAYAQDLDFGFATYVPIKDENIEDGSVVVTSLDGMYLARYPYDSTLSGVVAMKSAIVLGFKRDGLYPINTKGTINTRVSTTNGVIARGDLITSSTIAGVAMRATKSGMVLGTAMEDYTSEDPNEIGRIPVYIEIRVHEFGVKEEEYAIAREVAMWRVGLGAVLAVMTTILCFYLFGKYTAKMIEAMARNPLSQKSVRKTMLMQGMFLFIFVATGYAVSYILLRG